MSRKEESAASMGQSSNNAAMMDAPIMSSKEESVKGTEPTSEKIPMMSIKDSCSVLKEQRAPHTIPVHYHLQPLVMILMLISSLLATMIMTLPSTKMMRTLVV